MSVYLASFAGSPLHVYAHTKNVRWGESSKYYHIVVIDSTPLSALYSNTEWRSTVM